MKINLLIIAISLTIQLQASEYKVLLNEKHYKSAIQLEDYIDKNNNESEVPSSPYTEKQLYSVDLNSENDGLVTLDTRTGLEWLDVTQTGNKSYNQIAALLGTTYNGWRFPTNAEVEQLYFTYLPSIDTHGNGWIYHSSYPNLAAESNNLQNLFGTLQSGRSDGFYLDENGQIEILAFRNDRVASIESNWGYNQNSSYSYRGVLLVSDGGTSLTSQTYPSINTPLP